MQHSPLPAAAPAVPLSSSGTHTGAVRAGTQPVRSKKQGARLSSGRSARSPKPCRKYSGSSAAAVSVHSTTAHAVPSLRRSQSARAAAISTSRVGISSPVRTSGMTPYAVRYIEY